MNKYLIAAGMAVAGLAIAHEGHEHAGGKAITVVGSVIDTGCYVSHNGKGPDHAKCAETCAKAGVPLAIVDDKGVIYMPIAVEHKDQNARLMPFIEKRVKVTGAEMDKGGLRGIAIKTIEPAP